MDVEQSGAVHAGETALLERGAVRPHHPIIEIVHVPGYPRPGGICPQFLYRLPELQRLHRRFLHCDEEYREQHGRGGGRCGSNIRKGLF